MFFHRHPFAPFIPENATKLIVGTLPPPRFTQGLLKDGDVDFCYGSRDGQLWPILDKIFNLKLKFETTDEAIRQRKDFLIKQKIGICDIVESAERFKIDATDLGMHNVKLRNLIGYLQKHPLVDTLLFTGGNSKNGPEYFFRRHLKEYGLQLEVVSTEVPRVHKFKLPVISNEHEELHDEISQSHSSFLNDTQHRTIKTVSLTAPSGSANRAVGSLKEYQRLKDKNPNFTTLDFRVIQYKRFFTAH